MPDHAKACPELSMKRHRSVPDYVQSTAPSRTLGTEGGDDDVPARSHGICDLPHVRCPIIGVGEKVEDRAVVPHIELVAGKGLG